MLYLDAYSMHALAFSHYYFHGTLNFDAHFHTDFEVIYVISGELEMTVNKQTALAHAGDFALVLPNQIHSSRSSQDYACWFADFSADLVNTFAIDVRDKTGLGFVFSGTNTVAESILRRYTPDITSAATGQIVAAPLLQNKYETQALLYAICSEYARQIEIVPDTHASDDLIPRVARYIQAHFRENISLTSLAAALNYDVFYLSHFFNRAFQMNFRQYLNACRVNCAKQLIHETDESFTNIASECGYQSIRTFNHAFRAQTGLTPSAYRSQTAHCMFTTIDPSASSQYLRTGAD